MIVLRVELHSAVTGKVSELGRMVIANDGTGISTKGSYVGSADDLSIEFSGTVMRKGTISTAQRKGYVKDYPRQSYPVWTLIKRMLEVMKY